MTALLFAGCGAPATAPTRPRVANATRAQIDLAERHELARRHDQARRSYETAESEAPNDISRAFAARRFASTLISWGEYEAAESRLETVTQLAPGDASAWHDLGLLRHRRGAVKAARQALERSVQAAPRDPRPAISLAALLVQERQFTAATTIYRNLLDLKLPPRTRQAVEQALQLIAQETNAPPN